MLNLITSNVDLIILNLILYLSEIKFIKLMICLWNLSDLMNLKKFERYSRQLKINKHE